MRLYGSRHFALRIRLTMPPRPVAHAIMNHAMPRAHAVFPNDVYRMAAIGLSSFFVGPNIIKINNSGPATHPSTTNFYTAFAKRKRNEGNGWEEREGTNNKNN